MRRSLMETFDEIYILDLHGNALKREHAPDGGVDQNVFDIRQGVAIALFVKRLDGGGELATVHHANLWGERPGKYGQLTKQDIGSTEWTAIMPRAPQYFFVPRNDELASEYESEFSVRHIFPVSSSGIDTGRDKLTIKHTESELLRIVADFGRLDAEGVRAEHQIKPDTAEWRIADAKRDILEHPNSSAHIVSILYRPFDMRVTYFTGRTGGFMTRPRSTVMHHMLAGRNLGLITARQKSQADTVWHLISATRQITASGAISNKTRERNYLFPLYLYPTAQEKKKGIGVRPNLDEGFVEAVATATGLTFTPDGPGDLESTFGPEDVFHYIYAILHSPAYRTRYADFLKSDFPRIPLARNRELFERLIALGKRLTKLHLMEAEPESQPSFPIEGDLVVRRVRFVESRIGGSGQVYINSDQYFNGVSKDTWEFTIGGYRPAEKWLKDRRDRTLTADDVRHYRKMCGALAETQDLMAEIDVAITGAGGWPLG